MKNPRAMRRAFLRELLLGLSVIGPILSGLVITIVALGITIGLLEGWSISESIYFSLISGLTIGYGDLVPRTLVTRLLSIAIGICGTLVTALVAAVAVKALGSREPDDREK